MIALTWAGILHPWSSFQVLVPLIMGVVGLAIAMIYEFFFALHPSVCVSHEPSHVSARLTFSSGSTFNLIKSYKLEWVSRTHGG